MSPVRVSRMHSTRPPTSEPMTGTPTALASRSPQSKGLAERWLDVDIEGFEEGLDVGVEAGEFEMLLHAKRPCQVGEAGLERSPSGDTHEGLRIGGNDCRQGANQVFVPLGRLKAAKTSDDEPAAEACGSLGFCEGDATAQALDRNAVVDDREFAPVGGGQMAAAYPIGSGCLADRDRMMKAPHTDHFEQAVAESAARALEVVGGIDMPGGQHDRDSGEAGGDRGRLRAGVVRV